MGATMIELAAGTVTEVIRANVEGDWTRAAEQLRSMLSAQMDAGRCASVVVSAHFPDERCDHEVP
jgi:hypothetical protein